MKRFIFFVLSVLFLFSLDAQEVERVNSFIKKLTDLEGEHVKCDVSGFHYFLDDIVTAQFNGQDIKLDTKSILERLGNDEWKFIVIVSDDDEGYRAINDILDTYDVTTVEELFGIPLVVNQRESGNQRIFFIGKNHSIAIEDDAENEEVKVLYTNCNIVDVLRQAVALFTLGIDEFDDFINDGYEAISSFGNRWEMKNDLKADGDARGCGKSDFLNVVRADGMQMIEEMKKDSSVTVDDVGEMREELKGLIEGLKEKLGEVDVLTFTENPVTRDFFIVMSDEQMEIERFYGSIYTWINSVGLLGATKYDADDVLTRYANFITPVDVLHEYMIRFLPKEEWLLCNRNDNLTNLYKNKFPGGTPAVYFLLAQHDEAEYKSMLSNVEVFFDLKLKDTYRNLKVVQRSDRDGKRFVQLYGERKTMITVLDNPALNVCMMTITVGSAKDFENALNAYGIVGKENVAQKYNIIISEQGIVFSDEEYLSPVDKEMKKNGVHIDFKLKDLFLE